MALEQAGKAAASWLQEGPGRPGLYNRPRRPPPASFRSFLQALGNEGERPLRSFGGWRHGARCERAAADLLFLILDEPRVSAASLAAQVLEGAARFGYSVQVDRIEEREAAGREVFAIRELTGRAFGTARLGR